MMAALSGGLASQASNASIAASTSTGVEEQNKIKLRLCYNGRFQQVPSQNWKLFGGEYFNESISYGTKYADFMFKLSEKFKTAVSVKYLAPGEDLDPDSLISVQDDADLQELTQEYLSHLQRPGTPYKTFRIKVFVFKAAEEPMTPDEITEGQTFFSGSHAAPQQIRAYRGLDQRSSWGSTLSSAGTPSNRQPEGSTGDWFSFAGRIPSTEAGAGVQQPAAALGSAVACGHISAEAEQAALHNVRQSVANYPAGFWMTGQQLLAAERNGHVPDDMSGYDEDDEALGHDEDEQNIEECLAYIQQEQDAAEEAVASMSGSERIDGLHEEASFPEDPFQQGAAPQNVLEGDAGRLQTLPSHISAFGDDVSEVQDAGIAAADDAAGVAVMDALDVASQLPSHISAFGDDLDSNLQGVCGVLNEDAEQTHTDNVTNGGGRMAAPYGRFKTQDSTFSLDGISDPAGGADGPEPAKPDRQDSGDSLASLPKLVNPVHRLAKPDLKIISKIGEGAFGEVSVANAPLYGTVAVKWLKTERFGKHFASFGREAAMLADLNHPNVLRFYGVVTETGHDNTVIGIMTEYIRGGSLSTFLRMSRSLLPLRTRCELALAASNGLAYLHELHIVHFDLKPDNLLLDALPAVVRAAAGADQEEPIAIRIGQAAAAVETPYQDYKNSSSNGGAVVAAGSGAGSMHSPTDRRVRLARSSSGRSSVALEIAEVPVVKVADFGLSKHKLNSTYVSSCRDLRGTLPYMAPELVADPERVSEKADVWSLGVVMWEMLTREIPFQEYAPQQLLMGLMCGNLHLDIPEWCEPEWRGLLEACLEPNPSNRPSMRELARQLEAIRDQQLAQEEQQQREEEEEWQRRSLHSSQQAQQQPQPCTQLPRQESPQLLSQVSQQSQQGQQAPQPASQVAQVQQLQQQMQQLLSQPVPQPPPPASVGLLQRQQQQHMSEQQQHVQERHVQERQLLSERQQVQQVQLHDASVACLKQQMVMRQQPAAQSALQGISLSAHAGPPAVHHVAVSWGPGPSGLGHAPVELGLQPSALHAAATLAAQQQEQLQQLQQACALLQQPAAPLHPPGLGYIQPT